KCDRDCSDATGRTRDDPRPRYDVRAYSPGRSAVCVSDHSSASFNWNAGDGEPGPPPCEVISQTRQSVPGESRVVLDMGRDNPRKSSLATKSGRALFRAGGRPAGCTCLRILDVVPAHDLRATEDESADQSLARTAKPSECNPAHRRLRPLALGLSAVMGLSGQSTRWPA